MLFHYLTQMLGTTIADYVYSLETATAGSGVAWLKEHFLKVKYVSLVNLVADREVVRELVAGEMTLQNVISELGELLPHDGKKRTAMLNEYSRMMEILGKPGASQRAAEKIVSLLLKEFP